MATKKAEGSTELENNRNLQTMSIGEAKNVIKSLISSLPAEDCPAVVLVGSVGLGKTQSLLQIASELEMSPIVRHLSQVHPLDLGGVGLDGETKSLYFAKPPLYNEVMECKGKRFLLLDEIDRVQPIAQNTLLQILSERKQNGYHMPNTYVVAAANAWYAQYTFELDKAMASRMCIIHVQSSPSDWLTWASGQRVHPSIITTISLSPDVLNQHAETNDGALKVADPRAWHNLSKALDAGFEPCNAAMFVGEFAAEKFRACGNILRDYSKEIKQVLAGKQLASADAKVLFAVYLAAAGQVREIPQAESFIDNSRVQLGDEKAYIVGRLITYNIPLEQLSKNKRIHAAHLAMAGIKE